MIEDAKKAGLDLNNPYIRAEFEKLKEAKEKGIEPEAVAEKSDPVNDMSEAQLRRYLEGVVSLSPK